MLFLGSVSTLVLAGALLEQSEALIDRGIHPIRIADGFERACSVAVEQLDKISDIVEFSQENQSNLFRTAMTSLGSKMCVELSLLSETMADIKGFAHLASQKHTSSSLRSLWTPSSQWPTSLGRTWTLSSLKWTAKSGVH